MGELIFELAFQLVAEVMGALFDPRVLSGIGWGGWGRILVVSSSIPAGLYLGVASLAKLGPAALAIGPLWMALFVGPTAVSGAIWRASGRRWKTHGYWVVTGALFIGSIFALRLAAFY